MSATMNVVASHSVRLAVVLLGVMVLGGCARGLLSPQYGLQEGRLASCEGLRGCVSSHAPVDSDHYIAPLRYDGTRSEARNTLIAVLRTFDEAKIVSTHRGYVRVEFPSAEARAENGAPVVGMAIIDDTEFYIPLDEGLIHIRSTPRRNLPDAGENRERVELIRARFNWLSAEKAT